MQQGHEKNDATCLDVCDSNQKSSVCDGRKKIDRRHDQHYVYMLTGMLEAVQQRLWDNFSKQSKEEQSLQYCHLMSLSAALARCSANGHTRAADLHCQLILHAISNHFYSILRPKILAVTEMVSSKW